MSEILEMFVFFTWVMSLIINVFDSVYLGEHTLLDIFLSITYLSITLWGVFSLLNAANQPVYTGEKGSDKGSSPTPPLKENRT